MLEPVEAWKAQTAALEDTTRTLEKRVADLTDEKKKLLKVQQAALQSEELRLLRDEAKRIETRWLADKKVMLIRRSQQQWETERVELANENHVLVEKAKLAEETYSALQAVLVQKEKLLDAELAQCRVQQTLGAQVASADHDVACTRNRSHNHRNATGFSRAAQCRWPSHQRGARSAAGQR